MDHESAETYTQLQYAGVGHVISRETVLKLPAWMTIFQAKHLLMAGMAMLWPAPACPATSIQHSTV